MVSRLAGKYHVGMEGEDREYILCVTADPMGLFPLALLALLAASGTLAALTGAVGALILWLRGEGVGAAAAAFVSFMGLCISLTWCIFARWLRQRRNPHLHHLAMTESELIYRRHDEQWVIPVQDILDVERYFTTDYVSYDHSSIWNYRISYRDASSKAAHLDIPVMDFLRARERLGRLDDLLKQRIAEIRRKHP